MNWRNIMTNWRYGLIVACWGVLAWCWLVVVAKPTTFRDTSDFAAFFAEHQAAITATTSERPAIHVCPVGTMPPFTNERRPWRQWGNVLVAGDALVLDGIEELRRHQR